ncbi:MAG: hypothetical protein HY554_10305 [Elusimicrobia bacterium]|nr:hypothetical protein [Elusimicrobiota bacterium]
MAFSPAMVAALAAFLASPARARTLAGISLEGVSAPEISGTREMRERAADFAFFWSYGGDENEPAILVSLRGPATRVLLPHPVLVYFWGPEELPGPGGAPVALCPRCPEVKRLMERAHERYAPDGLIVVGLGFRANRRDMRGYQHLLGTGSTETAEALGLKDLGAWLLIDGNGGKVAASPDATEEVLFPWLESLLRRGKVPSAPARRTPAPVERSGHAEHAGHH